MEKRKKTKKKKREKEEEEEDNLKIRNRWGRIFKEMIKIKRNKILRRRNGWKGREREKGGEHKPSN